MWDEGSKDRGARDPPVSVLLLFDPKAPNARTAAGLLTRFGRHAFPSGATVAQESARLSLKLTATGIVPDLHRIPF